MKRWVLFCLCAILCFSLSSCATRVEDPVPVDITDVVRPVLDTRPDNSVLEVHPGPVYEMIEVLENMHTFMYAWEMWQAYAESLEEAIAAIGDRLSQV